MNRYLRKTSMFGGSVFSVFCPSLVHVLTAFVLGLCLENSSPLTATSTDGITEVYKGKSGL